MNNKIQRKINLFWDIDGTILNAVGAGGMAFKFACKKIYGEYPDLSQIAFHGACDDYICKKIIYNVTGQIAKKIEILELQNVYSSELQSVLTTDAGYLHNNVLDILLKNHSFSCDIGMFLQTGNIKRGATLKLRAHNIEDCFDFSLSLFGDGCNDRYEMIKKFPEKLRIANNCNIFIGDTIYDVLAAKKIGAYTIGVATGGRYSENELREVKPDYIWNELPKAEIFWDYIYKLCDRDG